jgi:hypothetical protein
MPECHEFEPVARRAFMVTLYAADAAGVMVASMPSSCLRREAGDPPCCLWEDHRRERKTGPLFALTVARCGPHDRSFTLYPPGHVPYGRIAIAPVSVDGALVKEAPSEERTAGEAPVAQPSLSGTVFGAAIDAAAGRAWPRQHPARPHHPEPRAGHVLGARRDAHRHRQERVHDAGLGDREVAREHETVRQDAPSGLAGRRPDGSRRSRSGVVCSWR